MSQETATPPAAAEISIAVRIQVWKEQQVHSRMGEQEVISKQLKAAEEALQLQLQLQPAADEEDPGNTSQMRENVEALRTVFLLAHMCICSLSRSPLTLDLVPFSPRSLSFLLLSLISLSSSDVLSLSLSSLIKHLPPELTVTITLLTASLGVRRFGLQKRPPWRLLWCSKRRRDSSTSLLVPFRLRQPLRRQVNDP